jgi:hypothetical protein
MMEKRKRMNGTQHRSGMPTPGIGSLDPNDLKNFIRDGLVSMTREGRDDFIEALETEMQRADLSMRSYLIPLGIPAMTVDELTPTEVGHLIRFLKTNVPRAMPAVERAIARLEAFAEHESGSTRRLAE